MFKQISFKTFQQSSWSQYPTLSILHDGSCQNQGAQGLKKKWISLECPERNSDHLHPDFKHSTLRKNISSILLYWPGTSEGMGSLV